MKKTVFITGSTRGIGKAIAILLAKNKYCVILHGSKKTIYSEKFIKSIKKTSSKSSIYYFDVSNYLETEKVCNKILLKYGKIDILINNAGIVNNKLFVKMNYEEFDKVIKTNLYGVFNVTKVFLSSMIKNSWGRIINMSSISAHIGDFGQTNYSASKAGIIGFTKSLSKEVAKYNITVNAICPGLVDTDILKDVPKEYMANLIAKIPLKRMAKPSEIAHLILFLISQNTQYITGEILNINGGML